MCIKKMQFVGSNESKTKALYPHDHLDLSFVRFDDPFNRIDKVIVDSFLDFLDVTLRQSLRNLLMIVQSTPPIVGGAVAAIA